MNIRDAKDQIKNAMVAYFTKDEFGNYVIPIERQRPVFLMGPPGIGKTAIMEQIASELGVGLVSYSMTHHTRQSALGLPFISKRVYDGKEYDISEYTMSEIIASVYDMIESAGCKEGILFLDEINCVSETLAPAMLQFLQYKIFGRHTVPAGWIVVTAGNPPEYNNSVRDFDIVTWDRLKRIDVTPDYEVWKEYAYHKGIHPAIMTYLDIKSTEFYRIETTVDGKTFVTARGWSDLSDMIRLYEKNRIAVKYELVIQYLQNPKIARAFATYYDLFMKYRSDYQIDAILSATSPVSIQVRAKEAKFDERLSLIGLMLDRLNEEARNVVYGEAALIRLREAVLAIKTAISNNGANVSKIFNSTIASKRAELNSGIKASSLSEEAQYAIRVVIQELENMQKALNEKGTLNGSGAYEIIKNMYGELLGGFKERAATVGSHFSNAFHFLDAVFKDGQEMVIFVTELTVSRHVSKYISRFGCAEYFKHNKELLFYERQMDIIRELEILDIDE